MHYIKKVLKTFLLLNTLNKYLGLIVVIISIIDYSVNHFFD